MSRRHHHHLQPYDYGFSEHSRDRERDQARGIEYQDDSLSSINSDDDSYLHHQHISKDKKTTFYNAKSDPSGKVGKTDKPAGNEPYHQKEVKMHTQHTAPSDSGATSQRLSRLETMLEELLKRNNPPPKTPPPPPASNIPPPPPAKAPNERRGQFSLEPRRHDFTTSMWINKIQEVSIQNNWDEKTTVSFMGSQMSGIIKAWHNNLPNYDYTWPEWKILISKMFPDNTDFVTSLKRLVTRLKQAEENMMTYYFSKMYLIEACKITGEDAVSCLIDGLNNQSVQEQAKAQNYLTPETLYSQFLMVLSDYTVDYSPAIAGTSDASLSNWYYQDQNPGVGQVAEAAIPEEHLIEYENSMKTEDFDYRTQGNQGFHGNEEGPSPKRSVPVHSRLDKRFMRPNNFRAPNKIPMAAKVCSICFNRGHLARNCRKTDKMMYCKLHSSSHNSQFYKKCIINQHEFDAFIDTGCTTVTIREREAHNLGVAVDDNIPHYLEVYGGGVVEVVGKTEFVLQVDAVKAHVRAVVVPDHVQDVSVVVGQEFLNQKNICVFLQNEALKIFEARS